ncbi:MAG: hypothetical protein M2R45_03852 [Verrucomicrobia subdivision 3 bacterium]|nr:hypothetical protein [Limisphaerales bacterium]MCS1415808.1 hypothetical protein [Limisphaerales bacterium]
MKKTAHSHPKIILGCGSLLRPKKKGLRSFLHFQAIAAIGKHGSGLVGTAFQLPSLLNADVSQLIGSKLGRIQWHPQLQTFPICVSEPP